MVRIALHGSIDDHHTPLGFLDSTPTAQHSKPQLFPISPRYFRPSFQQFPRCFVHALFDHATWPWPFPTLSILALDWREPPKNMGKSEKKWGNSKIIDSPTQLSASNPSCPGRGFPSPCRGDRHPGPPPTPACGRRPLKQRPRRRGHRWCHRALRGLWTARVLAKCQSSTHVLENGEVDLWIKWLKVSEHRFEFPTLAGEIRILVGWNPSSLVGQLHIHTLESTVIPFLRYYIKSSKILQNHPVELLHRSLRGLASRRCRRCSGCFGQPPSKIAKHGRAWTGDIRFTCFPATKNTRIRTIVEYQKLVGWSIGDLSTWNGGVSKPQIWMAISGYLT